MSEARTGPEEGGKRPRRGRWWRRAAWTLGVLAVLFVLVVFVLPTPVARLVVDRQLDGLGIAHEGIDTVDVDLWNSRVAVGPMRLRGGEAQPAQLGSVELTYSLANLFKRRALIETFAISGVDIHVRRLADGALAINGIRPPAAAPAEEPTPPAAAGAEEEGGEPPFGFGMQRLAFVDSRLVFEDLTGGTLTLELDRFELADVLSWAPEVPQQIALAGTLNDMPFAFEGTSTLFADPLRVELTGGFEAATVDKLAVFTGPTGLDRADGVLATEGRHAYTLADGGIEGTSTGTIVVAGVDLATPAGDTATAARVEIDYDLAPTIGADETVTLGGGLGVALDDLALDTAAGDAIAVTAGRVDLAELALVKQAELRAPGEAPANGATAGGGDAVGLLQLLVRSLIALGQEVLRHNVEGALTPTLALDGVTLRSGGQSLALGELAFTAPGLTARGVGDTWSLQTPLSLELAGITVAGDSTASVGRVAVAVDRLAAETTLEEARIGFDLRLDVGEARLAAADGVEAGLGGLAVATDAFEATGWPGRGRASGALAVDARDLTAALAAGDAPAEMRIGAVDVALSPLTVEDTGTLALATAGRIDVSAVEAALAGAMPLEVALAGVGVEVGEASLTPAAQRLAAELALTELTATSAGEPAQNVAVARVDVAGLEADPAERIAIERITVAGLDADVAVAAMGAAADATEGGGSAGGGAADGGPAGEAAAAPGFRLGALVVEAGSRVRVIDQSAGEAVQLRFDIAGIEAGPLDTTAPDSATAFTADLSVEDSATLTASGSATPLRPTPDGDVALRIERFPLPLISPYASKLGGVTIESGELSLGVDGSASGGALDGLVGLSVADLFLGEPSAEAAARFEDDFGVPLGFAVGILKDGDGVIAFDLPVSGTVAAPSVDYSEVVAKAIGGALASVFPTNWIGGDGAAVAIEPAPFAPGTAELSEETAAIADQIAQVLGQKATLRVRVCGKGAAADLAALRGLDPAAGQPLGDASEDEVNRILELALERGRAVRGYLVERHGIAAERIGECRTSYSFEGTAPPRAEFQL